RFLRAACRCQRDKHTTANIHAFALKTAKGSPMTSSTLAESIDILHVSKRYAQQDGTPLAVLDDISLRVRPGEFVSVLGSSGCGKSTLLRLIAGLDTDYTGDIV